MKKYLLIIALILVLLGAPAVALASSIAGAQYWAVIQISNNSTASTNVATTCDISTQNLIDGNYLNAQANDCVIRTSSGADVPFMPSVNATYPWSLWVPSIGANGYQSDILYTADSTGGEIRYFPADGGMTTPDSATLELGDNFTIEQKGWVDTSSGNAFALDYDGTDDFVLYPTISLGTTYSAEAWFKSDVAINDAVLLGLSSSPFNAILNLSPTQNKLKSADDNEEVSVAYTAWDTDWHYFVVTRSDTAVSFYMDGSQVSANQTLATNGAVSVNSTGAKYNNGTTHIFDGIIDEVRLSDSVRSSAEILANWNGGMGLPLEVDANTVALWHYDEGTGGTTYDETTNDYDGTITQAAWTADTFPYKRALAYKEDAFTMVVSDDRIIASIIGGETVTASGVSSGEHTIETTVACLPGIYEDFTTYTEVDANNKLTVIATKATAVDVDRDEDVYLYKDFTADHFNALDIDFEMYMATTSLSDGWGGMAITNTIGSNDDFAATDISVHFSRQAVNNALQLMRGSNVAADQYLCALDTLFYCTLGRAAGNNTANVTIYSDSGRTILLDTLSVAGFGATKYRYAYGFVNRSTGVGGADFDGYIQNLDLKEKYLSLYIDGALEDSSLLTDNVTDNSDNWTFVTNGSMPYMEYQKILVGGTLQQHIVWEYDTTFTDLSGNDHDATPTFRTSSSDPDVSAELTSFQPIREAKAPDFVLGEAPAFITPTENITSAFTTTPGAGTFPLAGVITAVANATGTPPQLPLLVIAVFIILVASLSVSATTRRYGSGSLIVKIFVIIAVMGIFIALKNFGIDFWMIVVFAIIATSIAFMSKQVGFS